MIKPEDEIKEPVPPRPAGPTETWCEPETSAAQPGGAPVHPRGHQMRSRCWFRRSQRQALAAPSPYTSSGSQVMGQLEGSSVAYLSRPSSLPVSVMGHERKRDWQPSESVPGSREQCWGPCQGRDLSESSAPLLWGWSLRENATECGSDTDRRFRGVRSCQWHWPRSVKESLANSSRGNRHRLEMRHLVGYHTNT